MAGNDLREGKGDSAPLRLISWTANKAPEEKMAPYYQWCSVSSVVSDVGDWFGWDKLMTTWGPGRDGWWHFSHRLGDKPHSVRQPPQMLGTPLPLSLAMATECPGGAGAGLGESERGGPSVRLQLGKRCCGLEAGGDTQKQPYRVDSWLFRSPLKCSNFFSVSSLKEPPMWQLYIQMRWPS